MIRWVIYPMVYLGSALMFYNIYGFLRFTRYIRGIKSWDQGNHTLYLPVVLLVCFLLGYLVVGLFGKPDIVVASILFGGSVFVYVMYRMLSGIVQRVIENEHLQAELLAAEESSRAKTSFLASISHEMRTPMNVILGMNALALKNPELPEAAREQLEKAGHSARYLSGLIDNLLTIQQVESGDQTLRAEPFSLRDALEQISAQASAACGQKGLEYHTSFAECVGRSYIGDAAKLKRAILCILDNAVKYTDAPGTVRFDVKCDEERDSVARVRFIVSDTGIGIDEAFLPRIFDPLTREDESSTNRIGGSGMGLTVAHNIVTRMGGSIEAESRKGVGSTFTVTVPLAPVPEDANSSSDSAPGDGRPEEASAVSLAGRRILIVEDIEENAEIVADLLELEDAQSERAENGQVAIDMVKQSPEFYYDAILMDLRMPVMDGLEATRRIRALERADVRVLPIIALTANAFENDVQNALAAGMNEHMAKPADADYLYGTLKKWIGKAGTEGGARD